ncbi:hypothetical protein GCWU000182_01154 [Abiotrophia defectiva ATCC 49176]|uniref:Uncharacterized protein n=1 Tax=Abiotrophia defectiva ATCC 49176 TaxID=592010 RepID=W1Q2X8_ABIDE|nr:hypothetical protein GCWU000182_01154 [Abiotrophia defectiva ATCC 49176]
MRLTTDKVSCAWATGTGANGKARLTAANNVILFLIIAFMVGLSFFLFLDYSISLGPAKWGKVIKID